jgi:uncharacterized membrane protein
MNNLAQKIKKEKLSLQKEFRQKLTNYLLAAFGLIAGLAWNDAVKSLIEQIFPFQRYTLIAKFLYALFLTLILVIIGFYFNRIFEREDNETKEGK